MGFLVLVGFPVDLLTNLTLLMYAQTKAVLDLAGAKHHALLQRSFLESASPGHQYRFHIANGGYRP